MKTFRPCSPLVASKPPSICCHPAHSRRFQRGALLIDALSAVIILTFLVGATAQCYKVGNGQQRLGASYSQVETNLRTALHLITRALRHGNSIVASVSSGNLNGKSSNTSQVIVNTPQTTGSNILFYVNNGTFYYQRDSDTSPTAVITGVQSLTLTYYQTTISTTSGSATTITRTQVNSAPSSATEVQINLNGTYQNVNSNITAYIDLRNKSAGSF